MGIAVVAHSFVIGAAADSPVTGRKADVMMAAHLASEAALRLVKPGNENTEVTETTSKIGEAFDCKPINNCLNEAQSKDSETHEFKLHEVYAVDVLVSTGEGKNQERDAKTTVFKKTGLTYMLKMKTSREFFSQVSKSYGVMPFNIRNCEEEKKARMGVVECVKHQVLQPFNVLYEKDGTFVAQFKFTVLLMPNGPMKITGLPFDESLYKSEKKVEDGEIVTLLKQSTNPRANKKKKKAAEKAVSEETKADDAPMLVES